MDNTENSGHVIYGNFPMMEKPIMAQLTIHVNNLVILFGNDIIKDFKNRLYQNNTNCGHIINQMIEYYTEENVKIYFSLVYGWDFNKKVG